MDDHAAGREHEARRNAQSIREDREPIRPAVSVQFGGDDSKRRRRLGKSRQRAELKSAAAVIEQHARLERRRLAS